MLNGEGKGIALHQATTHASENFSDATAARCFAPTDLSYPERIGQSEGCQPLTVDYIERVRLTGELNSTQKTLNDVLPKLAIAQDGLQSSQKANQDLQAKLKELSDFSGAREKDLTRKNQSLVEQSKAQLQAMMSSEFESAANKMIAARSQGRLAIRALPLSTGAVGYLCLVDPHLQRY